MHIATHGQHDGSTVRLVELLHQGSFTETHLKLVGGAFGCIFCTFWLCKCHELNRSPQLRFNALRLPFRLPSPSLAVGLPDARLLRLPLAEYLAAAEAAGYEAPTLPAEDAERSEEATGWGSGRGKSVWVRGVRGRGVRGVKGGGFNA